MKILKAKKSIVYKKEESYLMKYEVYNQKGNLIKSEEFGSDQSLLYRTLFTYNEHDLVIKQEHADAEGVYEVIEYQYDEKGNTIEERILVEGDEAQILKRIIHEDRTEVFFTDEEGNVHEKEVSHLDEEGKVLESFRFNHETQLVLKEKFGYHENGEVIAYQSIDGEGNVVTETGMTYNEKGQLVESWEADEFGKTSWRYEYEIGEEGESIAKRYNIEANTLDSVNTHLIDGDYEKELRELVGVQLEIIESTPQEYHHQIFDIADQLINAHKITYDDDELIQEEYFFNANALGESLDDEVETHLKYEYLFWED